jgi:hypothetical protein
MGLVWNFRSRLYKNEGRVTQLFKHLDNTQKSLEMTDKDMRGYKTLSYNRLDGITKRLDKLEKKQEKKK